MPRKKRYHQLHKCHHVMLRGVTGNPLFIDDHDRSYFCHFLQSACERHEMKIHGFCFMTNHIHLVCEPQKSPLHNAVHSFASRYARYFNDRHNQCGYLFQDRFRSIFVEDGLYLKRLMRYIHLNPVEAGLVEFADQYTWSSHQAYLGNAHHAWLTTEAVLSCFDINPAIALLKFTEFVNHDSDAKADLEHILAATRQGAYGTEAFVEEHVTQSIRRTIVPLCIESLMQTVCAQFRLTLEDLTGHSKHRNTVDARSVLALIGRKSPRLSLSAISKALNKNDGTISRLASRAEQAPDLNRKASEILAGLE